MPGNFICYRCKASFRDHHDLQRHYDKKKKCVAVGTIVEAPEWYCVPCKKPFSNKSHYTAHLRTQLHARMTTSIDSINVDKEANDTRNEEVERIPLDSSRGDTDPLSPSNETPNDTLMSSMNNAPSDEEIDMEDVSLKVSDSLTDDVGPSDSSDEHDDQAVDFVLQTVDTSKIRKTDENPPRVAGA